MVDHLVMLWRRCLWPMFWHGSPPSSLPICYDQWREGWARGKTGCCGNIAMRRATAGIGDRLKRCRRLASPSSVGRFLFEALPSPVLSPVA